MTHGKNYIHLNQSFEMIQNCYVFLFLLNCVIVIRKLTNDISNFFQQFPKV